MKNINKNKGHPKPLESIFCALVSTCLHVCAASPVPSVPFEPAGSDNAYRARLLRPVQIKRREISSP